MGERSAEQHGHSDAPWCCRFAASRGWPPPHRLPWESIASAHAGEDVIVAPAEDGRHRRARRGWSSPPHLLGRAPSPFLPVMAAAASSDPSSAKREQRRGSGCAVTRERGQHGLFTWDFFSFLLTHRSRGMLVSMEKTDNFSGLLCGQLTVN